MIKEERVDLLLEAQECIYAAVDKIKEAIAGTGEEDMAEAYVIPSLKMCASDNHGYLGSQPSNISELIDAIEKGDD